MSLVGDGGAEKVLSYVRSEGGSGTYIPKWGWGGEEDLYPVHSGGCSVTYVSSDKWGGDKDLSHVCSVGISVTDVPSGEWGWIGGSLACTQWRNLSVTCP